MCTSEKVIYDTSDTFECLDTGVYNIHKRFTSNKDVIAL